MELVKLSISKIKPYPNNPRRNDSAVEAVAESIRQCEYIAPIVVDENNVILAGHTRMKALKRLGYKEAECVVKTGLTEEQKRKYRLLDNKTNELAEWDFDLLTDELDGLDFDGFDFGFDLDTDDAPGEAIEDDYDAEPPVEPKAKLGDIYRLGRHRLMCGDSTKAEDVGRLMGGDNADVCITSPPYGMEDSAHLRKHLRKGYSGRDGKTFYGESKDDKSELADLIDGFYEQARKVTLTQFINIMMVGDNKRAIIDFLYNNRDRLVDIIVWNKHTCPPQIHENVLNNGYEFVFIFDNENGTRAIRYGDFKGSKSNYIETKREQNQFADVHKAVYSIDFVSEILAINTLAKTVYDPFGGTGTTLIACEQLDRTCYMMELSPQYIDVIIDRWEKFTGEKAKKLN